MTTQNSAPMGRGLRRLLLNMLVGKSGTPSNLSMGLVTEPVPLSGGMAMAEAMELSATGYRRQRLSPDAWEMADNRAEASVRVVFRNGSDQDWAAVAGAFLVAETAQGNVLVATQELASAGVPVRPEWTLVVSMNLDYEE